MPLLREVPPPAAIVAAERAIRDQRQHDVIDKRLGQLEADRHRLLTAANACRRATSHLPAGRDREVLASRSDALGRDFVAFRTLVELRDTAA